MYFLFPICLLTILQYVLAPILAIITEHAIQQELVCATQRHLMLPQTAVHAPRDTTTTMLDACVCTLV